MMNTTASGRPEAMAKMIIGKKIPRIDSTYLQYRNKLTETYIRVYDEALALDETAERMDDLAQQVAMLSKERAQLEVVMKRLEVLEQAGSDIHVLLDAIGMDASTIARFGLDVYKDPDEA